jgi:hypothetical protein
MFFLEPLSQEVFKRSFQIILYIPLNSDEYRRYKNSSNNSGYIDPLRRKMYGHININTVQTGRQLGPTQLSRSTNQLKNLFAKNSQLFRMLKASGLTAGR